MTDAPKRLGVVGAGTMGAGIAQLGCLAGMAVFLHDPVPEALSSGAERLRAALGKGAARDRWSEAEAEAAAERLNSCEDLAGLATCELVIEAAPERPELKRDLLERLGQVLEDDAAVIASNTSSIPITSIAGAAPRPENVVGMHFFNPPPLMKLVEVIPAAQSSERAVAVATAAAEAMGRRPIVAFDGPGFLVNRCGRPFYTEALRLLQERLATHEQIDRICRLGGGFRMGPFELMDMVGIDVGLAVARSFTELSFGEPRWRPNPLQAQKVAAGTLGRKTGSGWYDYSGDSHRAEDPAPAGTELTPAELRERGEHAGLVWCRSRVPGRGETGFHFVPPLAGLVELTGERKPHAQELFGSLGLHVEWVAPAPGLVLGRIAAQLVNEACFAIGEGVGTAQDVDVGLKLGLNHPRGPMEWAETIGLDEVFAILDGLWQARREERYRPAPELLRLLA